MILLIAIAVMPGTISPLNLTDWNNRRMIQSVSSLGRQRAHLPLPRLLAPGLFLIALGLFVPASFAQDTVSDQVIAPDTAPSGDPDPQRTAKPFVPSSGPAGKPSDIGCTLTECEQFEAWAVGKTVLANGRVVFVAETPGYWADQAEHRLAFVYTPGRCDEPALYFRYPLRSEQARPPTTLSGRFRVNAADWYDFQGRIFFPEGRIGTGYFDVFQPSLPNFINAVKQGQTLNSLSAPDRSPVVLHEYRLDGSRAAMDAAQKQCGEAPLQQALPAQETLASEPSGEAGERLREREIRAAMEGVSATCRDLGFLNNPLMAAEFDHLNRRLRAELQIDLEGLGIPYEVVCQDLLDGFNAEALADALIEKYRPVLN